MSNIHFLNSMPGPSLEKMVHNLKGWSTLRKDDRHLEIIVYVWKRQSMFGKVLRLERKTDKLNK